MPSRKKLCLTAGATAMLGLSTLAQGGSALLFPYITTADSAYTFITVFHNPYPAKGLAETPVDGKTAFSIGYVTKSINRSLNDPCVGLIFNADFGAAGGLLQWEIGNRFDLPADFGDRGALDYNVNDIAGNRHGYMVIRYDASQASEQLYGEGLVIDTANGTALSYAALHLPSAAGDFAGKSGAEFVTSWYPRSLAGTSWQILPVGTIDSMLQLNALTTFVSVSTNAQQPGVFGRNGVYQPVESNRLAVPACAGIYGIDDLLPGQAASNMGGWFSLKTVTVDSKGKDKAQPALIWKIQQSGELGLPVTTMHPVTIIQ